jgi:hypothetical protein
MRTDFNAMRSRVMKHPDRIDYLIDIESQYPIEWANWLTKHSQFVPVSHNQAPAHNQGGYGGSAYYKSVNP